MSKLMQLHQVILSAFTTKGYSIQTPISRKQLIKVITILIKQKNNHLSQQPVNQAIFNQIWNQTQNRLKQSQLQSPRTSQQIILEDIIQSFIDAIEILSNRITECQSTIQQMMLKRKQLEKEKDFTRAEMIHHKMVTLSTDVKQFQKDLVSLTYPFNQNVNELTKKLSLRKNSGQKSPPISKKSLQIDIPLLQLQNKPLTKINTTYKQQGQDKQLQQYLRQNNVEFLQEQTVQDAKTITLWILGLLMCLECTVMIVKYAFVNLMVFLLGFFVLLQEQFKPGMTKIALYSCMFSLLMDSLWLLLNTQQYINPQINSGLTLFNKKYQLYVWFLTIVQVFIKIFYVCLLTRYQYLGIAYSQQLLRQQNNPPQEEYSFQSKNRQIFDHYIPNMKQLLKIQKAPSSSSKA